MKGNTVLKFLGVTGFSLLIIGIFNKAKNLNVAANLIFDIVKVNIVGFDKIYLHLKVSNPSGGTVTFDSINTELFFNGINIGRLYYNQPVFIAQNSVQTYVFPVIMYPAGQIQVLTNILKTKAKSGIFVIKGDASVNGVPVRINKTFRAW